MIPAFLSHLPVWHEMPVPFVAVWSDEKQPGAAALVRQRKIDWVYSEQRSGVPDFGSTNSHRQRDCMMLCWCQICGKDGAHLYVIPNDDGTHVGLWDDGMILNPPVHDECFEYSKTICPHLLTTEPYAIVRHSHPLTVVAYTSENGAGVMAALPIQLAIPGVIGRELIVRAPS